MQDWKDDILLRGHDAAAFEKYLDGFTKEGAQAREDLGSLKTLMTQIGLATTNVEAALEVHGELGKKYRDALKSFDVTNQSSSAVVDKMVKGMDRPPTEALDGIVVSINQYAQDASAAIQKKAQTQARTAQIASIGGVTAGVVISVVLGLLLSLAVTKHIRAVAGRLFDGCSQVTSAST